MIPRYMGSAASIEVLTETEAESTHQVDVSTFGEGDLLESVPDADDKKQEELLDLSETQEETRSEASGGGARY
jgi:hypothetical protein